MTAPVGEVTTPMAERQERHLALARLVEQALGREAPAALLEQRHEGADAGGFDRLDDDLIGRFARKGRDLAGRDDLKPFLGLYAQARKGALPDHRVDARVRVLDAEIGVAGGMRAAIVGDFAAQPDEAEAILNGALQGVREFRNGEFGRIGRGFRHGAGEFRASDPKGGAALAVRAS